MVVPLATSLGGFLASHLEDSLALSYTPPKRARRLAIVSVFIMGGFSVMQHMFITGLHHMKWKLKCNMYACRADHLLWRLKDEMLPSYLLVMGRIC